MKISSFYCDITPSGKTLLAGYGPNVPAAGVHDPLQVCGVFLEDSRKQRMLLMSCDLLGLDAPFIRKLRKTAGDILHIPPTAVLISCTHTHSGPQTRSMAGCTPDTAYLKKLEGKLEKALRTLPQPKEECDVYRYSGYCEENINRRVILPDNRCISLPYRKELQPLAKGIRDCELSFLLFTSGKDHSLRYLICNYAAHPLTCQSDGLSGHLISADYPGVVRRSLREQLGIDSMFVSGACGDLHPAGFESGFDRTEELGKIIAGELIRNISDALRQPERFRCKDPHIEYREAKCRLKIRKSPPCEERELPLYKNRSEVTVPLAFAVIGDTALVGVPGELLAEPGLEIKWHSPYRQTMILYNSTGYLSYICHANAFLSGGYETVTSHLEPLSALKLVHCAAETLHLMKNEK